jgi:hypothetical protein
LGKAIGKPFVKGFPDNQRDTCAEGANHDSFSGCKENFLVKGSPVRLHKQLKGSLVRSPEQL